LKEISILGSNVKTAISATNIAKPVKTPNIIVGIKLDMIRIENPNITVIPVKNIAFPIVEWQISIVFL
jgi:hypothetical protein